LRESDIGGGCNTFLRYEGLERPVVIVADVKTEAERHAVRVNIALTYRV
jgi:hypothetical protein